ncbi:hypothetical protein ABIB85_007680 [Bradyrhizobium sp. JR1.5]
MNYNIVNDRCRMIQKAAKLRSVGPVTEIARLTPECRIGNPSVYQKHVASWSEATIKGNFYEPSNYPERR